MSKRIKNKNRFHDYSVVDEDSHEIEDLEDMYEKEAEEIEKSLNVGFIGEEE